MSGRSDVSTTSRFVSNSDQNEPVEVFRLFRVARLFFFSFIDFTKSRLCSSVSLAANKPKELAQGSNREPARSGVMSAREVACVRACIPPSLGPAHLAHIWDKSEGLAGDRPPCNLPPPPPPPTTSPRQPKHGARGANTFPFSEQKKARPLQNPPRLPYPSPSTAAACHIS